MAQYGGGSSRIIVKNLPRHANTQRLREHFACQGELTDVRLQTTKDGRTRQFAFIGYRSEDDAARAVKYFNRTFFDTTRISVELARKIGDDALPRPWSRHSEGSSAFKQRAERERLAAEEEQRINEAKQAGNIGGDEPEDRKLKEFLEVMQPRHKTRLWSNDDEMSKGGESNFVKSIIKKGKSKQKQERFVRSKKRGGDSILLKQSHVTFDDEDSDGKNASDDDDYQDVSGQMKAGTLETVPTEDADDGMAKNNDVSDMDYFKSRVLTAMSDDDEEQDDEEDTDEDDTEDDKSDEKADTDTMEDKEEADAENAQEESGGKENVDSQDNLQSSPSKPSDSVAAEGVDEERPEDLARATARLLVQNIPYGATEEELADFLEHHSKGSASQDESAEDGGLLHVHIVRDRTTRISKGYAFASFATGEGAARTLLRAGRDIFQGRVLRVLPARAQNNNGTIAGVAAGEDPSGRIVSFKQQREAQKKADAGEGKDALAAAKGGSIFLRQDAVADGVAERLGISKSELLDVSASDLAVRLALGETHAVAKVTESLEEAGVDINALQQQNTQKTAASSSILVKNLPHRADEEELKTMFEKHGPLARWVFVSSGTLALLRFSEPSDAQKAFKALAYRRYKNAPLYLQWIDKSVWKTVSAPPKKPQAETKMPQTPIGDTANDEEGSSLFVKNISFRTTDSGLRSHFSKISSEIRSVRIMKWKAAECKHEPKKEGLSKGFGFVEFASDDAARRAMQQLQGKDLDGHPLAISISNRGSSGSDDTKGSQKVKGGSTKLVVRNIPFEANKKDLHQLFKPLGQLKVLRLPKKFDGGHRGFAFVEFVSKQEARNAREALQSTHLYGRHLVIEEAKDETADLSELRAVTKSKFRNDEELQQRPSLKRQRHQ